jgi:hypothetical protein
MFKIGPGSRILSIVVVGRRIGAGGGGGGGVG